MHKLVYAVVVRLNKIKSSHVDVYMIGESLVLYNLFQLDTHHFTLDMLKVMLLCLTV